MTGQVITIRLLLVPSPYRQINTPTNVFEDSLLAMVQGNLSLLNHYMSLGNVANCHDDSGNSLLHYAVALGQIHCVSILCTK